MKGAPTTTYIDRLEKKNIEDILAENLGDVFGERFGTYRRTYLSSLNPDNTGTIPEFPLTIGFEMVNRCNLDCIMCYTVNHSHPKAALTEATIGKVLEEGRKHSLPAVIIGLGSEPLLYKKIDKVLEAVRNAGVMDVFLNTNGVLLTEKVTKAILNSGVTRVHVSLDAATPETFKTIRGKDELELIETNIRRLIDTRNEHGRTLPIVRVSFCVQPENSHERQAFADKWSSIADYVDFQALSDFSYVDEVSEDREVERLKDTERYRNPTETFCPLPFNSLHVWSNGDVTPCCTFYGKKLVIGNADENSLAEIWRDAPIERLREEFRSGMFNPVCRTCLAERDHDLFQESGQG